MRKYVSLGAFVTALALLTPAASAVARPVPHAVRAMCKVNRSFCSGYWTKVGGSTVYMLGTPMTINSRTGHVASVTGEKTERNYGTNECMSSYGVPTGGNGGAITHYGCNGSANQKWDVYFEGAYDMYYGYWGFINGGDGMCINNRGGSLATDNIETLWVCDTSSVKQWYEFVNGGLGIEVFGQVNSGMCLTTLGYTLYGDDIYISGCNGSANQEWGS